LAGSLQNFFTSKFQTPQETPTEVGSNLDPNSCLGSFISASHSWQASM